MKLLSSFRPSISATIKRIYGALKDKDSTAGSKVVAEHINEVWYAIYAVMKKAGITPNGQDENIDDSQFLTALTDLFENNMPYKAGKTYNVGDTFTIGGVTHIVIPEADGLTAKFSDAVGAFAGLTSAQETALSNKRTGYIESLKAGYERFRAEAIPLSLYENGLDKPISSGINLTSKYPKFFANCNGLNASGQYNTSRKAFIDDNLPYLNVGGVYKTFDVPQGFGIVNAFNDANIGSKTGGIADDSVADNHLINRITTFQMGDSVVNLKIPATSSNFDIASFVPRTTKIYKADGTAILAKDCVVKVSDNATGEALEIKNSNIQFSPWSPSLDASTQITLLDPNSNQNGELKVVIHRNTNDQFYWGSKMECYRENGGVINKAWFDTHPNTGAGLQLGYYTLLKMV